MRKSDLFAYDGPIGDPMGGVRAGGRIYQDPITATVAAVGGSLGSSFLQSRAADKASQRAADATNGANALQADQFYQTREDNLPLMELRNALLPRIQSLAQQDSDVSPQDVMADPGYQFGLNQGRQAVQGSAAARGGLHSGRTLQALNQFGTDYGTSKFSEVFNRRQTAIGNNFNRSMSAAGLGQAGVQQTQQAGANYANNVGANALGLANFQGAAGMASANAWGNSLNRLSSYGMPGGFGK